MTKIHKFYIDDNKIINLKKLIEKIFEKIPTYVYSYEKKIKFYSCESNQKKTILIPLNNDHLSIIVIKIYNNEYKTPEELLYLQEYSDNHYFYKDCYLAHFIYNNYDISFIKMKKADGDISNLNLSIYNYYKLKDMISNELNLIHINNLIHMDIKITNILYKKINNKYVFGLCDFELINYNNVNINNEFKKYYNKLYYINIPDIYDINFEKKSFDIVLKQIKNKKRISYSTI